MPRYALLIEYDGTPYVGYQVQNNGPSVQSALEAALRIVAYGKQGPRIDTVAAGRTDSGVHALGQVVHLEFPFAIPPANLRKALNALLDPSIRIRKVATVGNDFHARYSAQAKEYLYRVDLSDYPDPFKRFYTLNHPYTCDLTRLEQALPAIIGPHDFTSFCSTKTDKTDLVRTIYQARVDYQPELNELHFHFYGNGFLYNMVRILVGTLLQIGDGLKAINELDRLLVVKDRRQAGPTAAPQGLYMVRVDYPTDPFA
ncbi:tRNA pseudouridine(38-40) synthase TruA [Ignavigranum ruoffiae]|uniref:tRNA pseudouridine synthase A n=1 Tax=Ignavigranum ruoffiae TaxID=89093 RepID=A0A1H9D566_9LACT|nr:tRNA pseudouridine(38-40) synthase TruA [Ignavigranum ruoffiae]SEQ08519.1 tRNA pseudouridine38-40 synthase [Ignavigranum ruoffiae]